MSRDSQQFCSRIFKSWQAPRERDAFLRFRKDLFVDILGWSLSCEDDAEIDQFDTETAVYCTVSEAGQVVGGWRAVPTTSDYLSKDVFPQLASLKPYPVKPNVWEISRLGVLPHPGRRSAARLVYASMVRFAQDRHLEALIGTVEVSHGRNMEVHGLRLRRLGAPQVVGVDRFGAGIFSYCAELRLAEQQGRRFEKLCAEINKQEFSNESLYGSGRVSA